jgi:Pyruvate/2-oxoacid:ferredoxin oxidoreductase gamma subunit
VGALIKTTEIVSLEAMEKAMKTHVSERFRSLNLKALALGLELGGHVHG